MVTRLRAAKRSGRTAAASLPHSTRNHDTRAACNFTEERTETRPNSVKNARACIARSDFSVVSRIRFLRWPIEVRPNRTCFLFLSDRS